MQRCEFVSVWDGDTVIRTAAQYCPQSGMVTTTAVDAPEVELLDREYLELPDGTELEVCPDCHEAVLAGDGECPNSDCNSNL